MKNQNTSNHHFTTAAIIASATASTLAHATTSETAMSNWAKQQKLLRAQAYAELCESPDFRQNHVDHCWKSLKLIQRVSNCGETEQIQDFYQRKNIQQEMLFTGGESKGGRFGK